MMILSARNISKTFHDGAEAIQVLDAIDLSVSVGEYIAIMGPSGCGKTTLLQIISGLAEPSTGSVVIDQRELSHLSSREMSSLRNTAMGFVYQQNHLLPELSVIENVALPQQLGGVTKKEAQAAAMELLERLGLTHRAKMQVNRLSGGERQRVAIARAVVNEPQVVFADEPTGNLDETHQEEVIELIHELCQQAKTSWVVVTHDKRVAEKADRVLCLAHGRLQEKDMNTALHASCQSA